MIRSYKVQGLVLKRQNIGEADKIITLYTHKYGKIRVLAKGIRRLSSRKGGNLELFRQVDLSLAKGHNLDIVTEVQVVNPFSLFRKNLTQVAVAYYFCELVDRLTPEGQENNDVYQFIITGLSRINQGGLKKQVRDFEEGLLDRLGFGVPDNWRRGSKSLLPYIETITEKKINSPEILHDLCA